MLYRLLQDRYALFIMINVGISYANVTIVRVPIDI